MKERPILFSAEMVRAILYGRKTQTRRVIRPQPTVVRDRFPTTSEATNSVDGYSNRGVFAIRVGTLTTRMLGAENFAHEFSPFGQPGDRLWVRETFGLDQSVHMSRGGTIYRADVGRPGVLHTDTHDGYNRELKASRRWRSPIHMPRWASRLTLEVTAIRVERLQEIRYADVLAEGCPVGSGILAKPEDHQWYRELWNSLNETRGYGWDVNPWVWVIEFKRLTSSAEVAA